ncbi:MAG: RNA-binding S4 domain-containing protein [Bacteroidetes bacterium]|nr:RNA-binding S4 domain-containing protein [Bacteroidota bacterium]
MKLRIDKFIWCVRLTKTRALAAELIAKNKIKLNDLPTKASKDVSVGDTVFVYRNSAVFTYSVLKLTDKRLSASLVSDFIQDTTSIEEKEKNNFYLASQKVYRLSDGKPTKKDRREIEDFLDQWAE